MRVCACGKKETEGTPFYRKSSVCRSCYYRKKASKNKEYKSRPEVREKTLRRERRNRQDPRHRVTYILKDSRNADKKRSRVNNLTREFVEGLVTGPCSYCGETDLKITLDRKDNTVGHTIENVVPCCERCNYLRRDMPYEAWLSLTPSIRKVREAGLFGYWVGGTRLKFGR